MVETGLGNICKMSLEQAADTDFNDLNNNQNKTKQCFKVYF